MFKFSVSVLPIKIICKVKKLCSYHLLQCPPNLHKQDGYFCQVNQVRRSFESLDTANWKCIYCLCLNVWRVAATMESVRPGRTSVNISGGQVRQMLLCFTLSQISITIKRHSMKGHTSSLFFRGWRLRKVLLWEAEHGGHREGQLWERWRKVDPV